MSMLADGFGGYLALLLAGVLVHEPWRWAGLYLGRNVDANSEVFRWVRAVATALVAALVVRLVLFPAGVLEGVPLWIRIGAFGIGIGIFYATRKHLATGIIAGTAALVAVRALTG